MTTAILTRLTVARSLLAELRQLRSGNPNHDAAGKFASGPGSKGHAKRVKRRKRKLEQLRKEGHKEIREFRVSHRADRRELVKDQAEEWKGKRREHVRERNQLRREHKRGKTGKAERRKDHADLRTAQKHERQSLHEDHVTDRAGMRKDQHDDRREVIDRLKSDLHDDVPGRSKTGRKREKRSVATLEMVGSIPPGQSRARPGSVTAPGRLTRRTTHKAGTAEAILAHCLRRRGWSARFAESRLTGRQHLVLLEDVRQYGRAWLRHEAEAFFASYGTVERGLGSRIAGAIGRFFDRSRQFIRELIGAGAQALKGPEPLTDAETAFLDTQARIQAEYLRKFEEQVAANPPAILVDQKPTSHPYAGTTQFGDDTTILVGPPPMTAGQFTARAEMYASSAHQAAQKMVRKSVAKQEPAPAPAPPGQPPLKPVTTAGAQPMERRVLGHPKTEHCHDCPPLAALGWQSAGTLPDIGVTECGGLCLCTFEFRDGPAAAVTVNGKAAIPQLRPPRKITLKKTPYTQSPALQRPETPEDIAAKAALHAAIVDAEVKKYLAGQPSILTVGTMSPRIIAPIPAGPAPHMYMTTDAQYDAAGNLIIKDYE